MKAEDLQIVSNLRKSGRISLTTLSKKNRVAHSTLFDRLHSKTFSFMRRYTVLLDFAKLGFSAHAYITLAVEKQDKQPLIDHLLKSQNVNSLFRINNGWDVNIECIFKDMRGLENFVDQLDAKFKIRDKQVHYVIEELRRESFLADPSLAQMILPESQP